MAGTLQTIKHNSVLSWTQQNPIPGFNAAVQQGPFVAQVTPAVLDCNSMYMIQGTLLTGTNVVINLNSLTDPAFGEALAPEDAFILEIQCTGATWTIGPFNASHPLTWFWGGSTQTNVGNDGASLTYADTVAAVVDSTHNNIQITNTGAGTLTYLLALALGV